MLSNKDFKVDSYANSPTFYFRRHFSKPRVVSREVLSQIWKSKVPKQELRLCLHESTKHLTQVMIIRKLKGVDSGVKLHSKYGKYIKVIKGKIRIAIYSSKNMEIEEYFISKKDFGIYVPRKVFHKCESISKKSLIIEVVSGPFNRKNSNTYMR